MAARPRRVPQRAAGRSGAAAPPVTSPSLLFPSPRRDPAPGQSRRGRSAAPPALPPCPGAARPPVRRREYRPAPGSPRVSPLRGVRAPRRPSRAPAGGAVLALRGGSGAPAARPARSRRCWRSRGRTAAPAAGGGRSSGSSRVSERPKRRVAGGRAAPAPVLGFGGVVAAPGFGLGTQLGAVQLWTARTRNAARLSLTFLCFPSRDWDFGC